jgi:hypothetical protein
MSQKYVKRWRERLFYYYWERGLDTLLRPGLFVPMPYKMFAPTTTVRLVNLNGGNRNE